MSDEKEGTEKPLDKMTVKELREVAADIPEITGVHGMKKAELLEAIKEVNGVTEEEPKGEEKPKSDKKSKKAGAGKEMSVKEKIHFFKAKRKDALSAGDKNAAKILRRRINRLKKKSRRAA